MNRGDGKRRKVISMIANRTHQILTRRICVTGSNCSREKHGGGASESEKGAKKNNQLYVSESRPTMYSSVVMGAYFGSLPGR